MVVGFNMISCGSSGTPFAIGAVPLTTALTGVLVTIHFEIMSHRSANMIIEKIIPTFVLSDRIVHGCCGMYCIHLSKALHANPMANSGVDLKSSMLVDLPTEYDDYVVDYNFLDQATSYQIGLFVWPATVCSAVGLGIV